MLGVGNQKIQMDLINSSDIYRHWYAMIEQAIFICGCGHSGTSLMANIFASHSQVYIPLKETEAFLNTDRISQRLFALESEYIKSGKNYLFEKTPRHIHSLFHIRETIPQPKFVLMVRDGRDVAASFIKRFGSSELGALRWIKDNEVVRSESASADVMIVRYEDLIANFRITLENVCRFTGVPFEVQMLEYYKQPRLWFGSSNFEKGNGQDGSEHIKLRNWQVNQPLFDGRGQWLNLLTESDLQIFETETTKSLMQFFGYD